MPIYNDKQSRKWQITINNPLEHGYTHEKIKEILGYFKSIVYWCMADEVGLEEKTPHTHIFLASRGGIRFSTLWGNFKGAHFELARGSSQENRNYIFKQGEKWENDAKKETNLSDTHEEWGEIPIEMQGKRTDIEKMYGLIKEGYRTAEIIDALPHQILNVDRIERARQMIKQDEYQEKVRFDLKVVYVFGRTGAGKTRDILLRHGYADTYRVTDYEHPFEGYQNQNVIVFEEFRSSLRIGDMLNYLDIQPCTLPARYSNKTACYETVYIVSNEPLEEQYIDIQGTQRETWKAFLRRIHRVEEYTAFGIEKYSTEEYFNSLKLFQQNLAMSFNDDLNDFIFRGD